MNEIVKRPAADAVKELTTDAVKPPVEVVEGPESPGRLSPVQLERIGRNLRNTTLLCEWMTNHLDEIFNASPKSNYALAILDGDIEDSQIQVYYFRKKYTKNFGLLHRVKSAFRPDKVDAARSGLERVIDIFHPGRDQGVLEFLRKYLDKSEEGEVSFHLEYKYQDELRLML